MAMPKTKRKGKAVKKAAKGKKSTLKVVRGGKAAKTAKVAKVAKKRSISVSDAYSKSQLFTVLAENCDLSRKQVAALFEALQEVVCAHLTGRGPEVFTLPGLLKITVQHKPATKARKGINPFTGEPAIFKAKPARRVVKVRALKKLKEMV